MYLVIGLLTIFVGAWLIMYAIPSLFITIFNTVLGNLILILIIILSAKYNINLAIGLTIIFIIIYQFSHLREGFGFGMPTSLTSQYANLAPLPTDNAWSQETIDAYKKKYIEANPGLPETFTDNEITLKQTASSEEEAKIFIDTGLWPWDDFMIKSYTTTINNAPENKDKTDEEKQTAVTEALSSGQKNYPNRTAFELFGLRMDSVKDTPQGKLLNTLKITQTGYDAGNSKFLKCNLQQLILTQPDAQGVNTVYQMSADSAPQQYPNVETNYSILPSLIPGFKFINNSCDICNLTSQSCAFSINGAVTSPWDVFWGTKPSSESTPSTVASQQSADPSKFPELNKIKTELNTLFPSTNSSSSSTNSTTSSLPNSSSPF